MFNIAIAEDLASIRASCVCRCQALRQVCIPSALVTTKQKLLNIGAVSKMKKLCSMGTELTIGRSNELPHKIHSLALRLFTRCCALTSFRWHSHLKHIPTQCFSSTRLHQIIRPSNVERFFSPWVHVASRSQTSQTSQRGWEDRKDLSRQTRFKSRRAGETLIKPLFEWFFTFNARCEVDAKRVKTQ